MENMDFDPESDVYTCKNGKKLNPDHIRRSKSETGYISEKRFTGARTAAVVCTKANVSKATTVKHHWQKVHCLPWREI